jgi:hypothetical protein
MRAFRATVPAPIARCDQFTETGMDLDVHQGEAPIAFGFDGGRHSQHNMPSPMCCSDGACLDHAAPG